jgi:hypothetical protein
MKSLHIKSFPALLAVSVLALSSCEKEPMLDQEPGATAQESDANTTSVGTTGDDQEYIVTMKEGSAETDQDDVLKVVGEKSHAKGGKADIRHQKFGHAMKGFSARLTKAQLEEMKKDGRVANVEADQPIHMYQTTTTTSTTSSTQIVSWGATRVGMGSGVGKTAWVIDTGVDKSHPDLTVDLVRSKSFLTAPVSLGTTLTSPWDERGHGTNVAGIIAAKDNGIGAKGVAAGATIVSLRVMDKSGAGKVSAAIAALNHVALNGKPGDVVNMSLGSSPSLALDNAVIAVANKGIFVTIAAGNSSANAANYSPARVNHPNVFTISGFKTGDIWNPGSNYGPTTVDYTAPGAGVYTTAMGSLYKNAGGTSMASPHVAGLLLLKGNNIASGGIVSGDPDAVKDKIAHF